MSKKKIRQISIYLLLAFVVFLYIFTILVFLFGELSAAIGTFAYSTFFTVVVYFLIIMQKRMLKKDEDHQDNISDKKNNE